MRKANGATTYRIPSALPSVSRELVPGRLRDRVLGQGNVAGELEHATRRARRRRLGVESHIPNPISGVLRSTGLRLVDEELLADGVRAHQRNENVGRESLGREQLDQLRRLLEWRRQKPVSWRLGGIFAPHKCLHPRAERAHDGGGYG